MLHIDQAEIKQQLLTKGVDPAHIKALHIKLQSGELDQTSFVLSPTQLLVPEPKNIVQYDAGSSNIGITALKHDELLLFWLNGGAATRYGSNLAKGVSPVIDDISYLELKILDLLRVTKTHHLASHPPVVIMNSFVTDQPTREHLDMLYKKYSALDPTRIHFVVQQEHIPRFTNTAVREDIDVFVDQQGKLSWAPCGHGDFVYLLRDYLAHEQIPNVKYLFFSNIDNIAATLDVVLLGQHIKSQLGRTVEIVDKSAADQGGVPCLVDGKMTIVEQMKFPPDFDYAALPWLNTNTFWFTLSDLLKFDNDLPWVLAEKTITEGNVIQLERFACDVDLPSQYVLVNRLQRFWPIKRLADLDAAKQHPAFKKLLNLLQY
ncbi:MAG: UTP--glucose-1-phosphate uridylyltransferase [Patescibacteria group bacterium]